MIAVDPDPGRAGLGGLRPLALLQEELGQGPGRVDQVVAAGATRVVVVRAITEASDPEAAAQLAGIILRQLGNNGQAVPLETFVDQVLKPHNITAEDFQNFLEHDVSIQQLVSVIGASGKLVSPAEIKSLYVQEYQDLAVDAVFFSASNYMAKIQEPAPEALAQFYTNQLAAYR